MTTATIPTAAAEGRRSKSTIAPLEFTRKRWLQAIIAFNFVFLYFPIVALIALSFNDSKRNITWQGFTLKYYGKAFTNPALHDAALNTLIIAFVSTVIS